MPLAKFRAQLGLALLSENRAPQSYLHSGLPFLLTRMPSPHKDSLFPGAQLTSRRVPAQTPGCLQTPQNTHPPNPWAMMANTKTRLTVACLSLCLCRSTLLPSARRESYRGALETSSNHYSSRFCPADAHITFSFTAFSLNKGQSLFLYPLVLAM